MIINIVHIEDSGWILKKFALKLKSELENLNCTVTISKEPRQDVDVNHYVFHEFYQKKTQGVIDSLMITHIDTKGKESRIIDFLTTADVGISMSRDTQQYLYRLGISAEKLYYINPAHDSNIKPRKRIIGITTNVYPDGRKNEQYLLEVIGTLNPDLFKIVIIGSNWEPIVETLRKHAFEVDYFEFDYNLYHKSIIEFDYYFYFGFDEGSMGVLDALNTGAEIVTTPQGFHLDFVSGNISFIRDKTEFRDYLTKLDFKISGSIRSVEDWTWSNYALKHLQIWSSIKNPGSTFEKSFKDGIGSRITSPGYIYRSKLLFKKGILNIYIHSPEFFKKAYRRFK